MDVIFRVNDDKYDVFFLFLRKDSAHLTRSVRKMHTEKEHDERVNHTH